MNDIVISGGTVVLNNSVVKIDIGIVSEKIVEIGHALKGKEVISAAEMLVVPGGVDPHVHLEMPAGETSTSETWKTGSKAAAFGGTTTVIDFVETRYPDQTLMEAFAERKAQASGKSSIDFGFHMTIAQADEKTLKQLPEVISAGMPSFKMYTTYSGFHLSDEELLTAFESIRKVHGLAMVHAESDSIIQNAVKKLEDKRALDVHYFPESRPAIAEIEAIDRVIHLAAYSETPIYVVHISTGRGAEIISHARTDGQSVWGETCPQYLLLDETKIKTRDFEGAKFVCCPPLRTKTDQETIWQEIMAGGLQTIGTDHCAFNFHGQKEMGRDSFLKIPSGLPGIELRMSLIYTHGVMKGKLSLLQWVDACCTMPAKIFGLHPRKGEISVGADADIVLFDPNITTKIHLQDLHENVDYSPFTGEQIQGRTRTVLQRGRLLVKDGKWVSETIKGEYLPAFIGQN